MTNKLLESRGYRTIMKRAEIESRYDERSEGRHFTERSALLEREENDGGEMFRQSGLNGVKQFHAQGRSNMR